MRPPQARRSILGVGTLPSVTGEALAELIAGRFTAPDGTLSGGTLDRFFALRPTLDQVIQLLRQNGGVSQAQLRMRSEIKRRALQANLCQTGADYIRLMGAHLPDGVAPTAELQAQDQNQLIDTVIAFIS